MPRKDRKLKGPVTAARMSAIGRANSQKSSWRTEPALHSPRQRKCREYFDALAEAGDTRGIPRPELD